MLNSDSGTSIKKRAKMDIDFDSKVIATSQDDIDIGVCVNKFLCKEKLI